MVGLMATTSGSKVSSLISSVIFAADNPSKLEFLRQLKEELSQVEDTVFLSELLPSLLKLFSDRFSPVRKCAIEYAFFTLSLSPLPFSFMGLLIMFYLDGEPLFTFGYSICSLDYGLCRLSLHIVGMW